MNGLFVDKQAVGYIIQLHTYLLKQHTYWQFCALIRFPDNHYN